MHWRVSALQVLDFTLHASLHAVNGMGHRCHHRRGNPALKCPYSGKHILGDLAQSVSEQALERAKNEVPRLSEQLLCEYRNTPTPPGARN